MANILDLLKVYITPELLGKAAKFYGESETGISKTIGSLAPTILLEILEKSSDTRYLEDIFNTLRSFDPAITGKLDSLLNGGNLAHNDPRGISGQLLGSVFGANIPAITNATASFSGVKPSSATSLLGIAGLLVLGVLSQKIKEESLNASGLFDYLLGQKSGMISVLPASIVAVTGATNFIGDPGEKPGNGLRWLGPLVLLFGLGAAVVFWLKNC